MRNGARASARFNVRDRETQETPDPLALCVLKRRKRRAPASVNKRYPFVRASIVATEVKIARQGAKAQAW
jgi:hypothetical protein